MTDDKSRAEINSRMNAIWDSWSLPRQGHDQAQHAPTPSPSLSEILLQYMADVRSRANIFQNELEPSPRQTMKRRVKLALARFLTFLLEPTFRRQRQFNEQQEYLAAIILMQQVQIDKLIQKADAKGKPL